MLQLIRRFAFSGATLGLVLTSGACSSTSMPAESTEVADPTRTSLSLLPATLREQVAAHVDSVAANEGGAPWVGATLEDEVDLILQPGVAGPAFYQVHVQASGERRGYLIFKSAPEAGQSPIVSWSMHDSSPIDAVRAEAKGLPSQSLLMLDPFTAVLEDSEGGLVAPARATFLNRSEDEKSEGRTFATWREAKAAYAARAPQGAPSVHLEATAECPAALCKPTGGYSLLSYTSVTRAVIDYVQIAPTTSPNGYGCYSGCGPTAWAMYLGWLSDQAQHNPGGRWGGFANLFSGNQKSTIGGNGHVVQNAAVTASSMELHDDLGTSCAPFSSEAYTLPSSMGNVRSYFAAHGLAGTGVYSDGEFDAWVLLGYSDAVYLQRAISAVDSGVPAVLGYTAATGYHYGLVTGHQYQSENVASTCPCGFVAEFIGINNGWGNGETWYNRTGTNLGAFYSGWVTSPPPPPPPPHRCRAGYTDCGGDTCVRAPAVCP